MMTSLEIPKLILMTSLRRSLGDVISFYIESKSALFVLVSHSAYERDFIVTTQNKEIDL